MACHGRAYGLHLRRLPFRPKSAMLLCVLLAAFLANLPAPPSRAEIIGRDDRRSLPSDREAQLESAIGILVYRLRDDKGRLLKRPHVCTATCVGPHLILTTAHCVMRVPRHIRGTPDLGTMRFILHPGDGTRRKILDIAGFPVDSERRKLIVAGPGNVKSFNGANALDWALLPLAGTSRCPQHLRMRPVDVRDRRLRHGRPLMLIGYHGDLLKRGIMHLRYSLCHVRADRFARKIMRRELKRAGKPVLLHDCDATRGASGSPMLVKTREGRIRIVAVVSGHKKLVTLSRDRKTGRIVKRRLLRALNVAAPVENIIPALKRIRAQRAAERERGKVTPYVWQEWLTNAVGLLLVRFTRPDGSRGARMCTAVCVGPHHVATAARCLGLGENASHEFHTRRMGFVLRPHLGRKGAIRLIVSGDDFYNTTSAVMASGLKNGRETPADSWVVLRLAHGRGKCPVHLPLMTTLPPPGQTIRAQLVGLQTCDPKRFDLRLRPVDCQARTVRKAADQKALSLRCAAPVLSPGQALVAPDGRGLPRLLGIVPARSRKGHFCPPAGKASSTPLAIPARNFAPALRAIRQSDG